jgi:hypothetical protein
MGRSERGERRGWLLEANLRRNTHRSGRDETFTSTYRLAWGKQTQIHEGTRTKMPRSSAKHSHTRTDNVHVTYTQKSQSYPNADMLAAATIPRANRVTAHNPATVSHRWIMHHPLSISSGSETRPGQRKLERVRYQRSVETVNGARR